jgi:mannose-6-phosphate isomerase
MPRPYPLLLEPILLEKVWGGSRLSLLGKSIPEGKRIGESWELADLACTSPTGAGGEGICSRILNGELAGHTLHDAVQAWGADLLGSATLTPEGGFPLLVKFLDARENLSIQVHPSPAYAAAHAGCRVKSECWYVIDAAPGSVIYKGIRAGISREQVAADAHSGRIVDDLIAVPAVRGECHLLPSGTCHALGAGVLVAEVQTPSDTTFRLYDWGRGRPLHIAEALECLILGPAPEATRHSPGDEWSVLAETDDFAILEGRADGLPLPHTGPQAAIVLDGKIEFVGAPPPLRASTGQTILIPAAWHPDTEGVPAIKGAQCLLALVK